MVSADASFRRYFRYQYGDTSYVLVDAPPATEKNIEFIHFSKAYANNGLDVPRVLFSELEQGFLCLTDLGDQTLLPLLHTSSIDDMMRWYQRSLNQLPLIATINPQLSSQHYDKAFFELELGIFDEWFCHNLIGIAVDPAFNKTLVQCFDEIIASALEQPIVTVHRDFHARNIMVRDLTSLAVIDFQDTVLGPLTYDAVSLLKDCYFELTDVQRTQLLEQTYHLFIERGLINSSSCEFVQFKQWFDWMGLQRHLKVCGIFARLYLRDNKADYLKDLPLVVDYIMDTAKQYPQLSPIVTLFDEHIIPVLPRKLTECMQ
ncbi:aminoglycoside phosphotransferase family protein [Psychrobium sp. 1_MG-2023]|uniref:aminoglycoside phosphotransferase family protein n=1 Tax=Psychrobium sp. 1_MG-2023 TaxID=3062624 RepID=UPI0026C15225|nr:phosphotransferase [Psychrobium sp. 1_MG-2023]MDP2559590.1 phosphotransferase [Psychrobium sp. 1_MG-2023]